MERYKKKELLQFVEFLTETNDSISGAADANPLCTEETLAGCQETAIHLGTYIETLGETYHGLVKLLEDYCELIYQMSISLSDEKQCRKLAKKIRRQLTQLQIGIQYELPDDRKEMVFLPYKASMWDSLESVWKAADADKNTDVYVIPVPYFDKNPDGSLRDLHDEGEQYPDYVPITRFDTYDFEKRRPDAIFIHNAYDNANRVTSVHPYFYSDNLKKFTDQLIYIPYFVLPEDFNPEDPETEEEIGHFCTVPGVIHADQVIVQSEAMKTIYVNVLTKLAGDSTRAYWEDKITGIGSPKMDKVIKTQKERVTIPDEWKRIIFRPDGTRRKLIFYNTSISALLQYNEQMIEKINHTFHVFWKYREEVALLWRPHPLIESTLISMRPQLWEQYQTLRDWYRSEGWGIYDDTPELNRAIEVSDAYYGDPSSVIPLYEQTGKPIMIQAPDL